VLEQLLSQQINTGNVGLQIFSSSSYIGPKKYIKTQANKVRAGK